jgi:hypothetical protein
MVYSELRFTVLTLFTNTICWVTVREQQQNVVKLNYPTSISHLLKSREKQDEITSKGTSL